MNTNNNLTSPNFGMAMRIKPEARESLAKAPKKLLEELKKCGEELKDTKYYDLVIDHGKYEPSYQICNRATGEVYTHASACTNALGDKVYLQYLPSGTKYSSSNMHDELLELPKDKVLAYTVTHPKKDILKATELENTIDAIRAMEASKAYTTSQKAAEEGLLNDLFSEFGS